jgi:hypothetical protein
MTSNELIEEVLEKYRPAILDDYELYRNHVYRVFSNCLLLDNEVANHEKFAIAAVFHDIGIWTNQTFDYLEPSELQAILYLTDIGKTEWIEEITSMIHWHHKLTSYKGNHQKIVNTFRKADWIDISLGLITFRQRDNIRVARRNFPNLGFHLFLIKQTIRRFLKHPLSPLPMLRK